MIKTWTIETSPTDGDPARRLLLLKGSKADVQGLILRLGAVCGRPKRERQNRDFNFRIFLHGVADADLAEIENELKTLSGREAEAVILEDREDAPVPEPQAEAPLPEPISEPSRPGLSLSLPEDTPVSAQAVETPAPAVEPFALPEAAPSPAVDVPVWAVEPAAAPEAAPSQAADVPAWAVEPVAAPDAAPSPAVEASAPSIEAVVVPGADSGPFSQFSLPANSPPAVSDDAEAAPAAETEEELGPFAKFGRPAKAAPAAAPPAPAKAPPAKQKPAPAVGPLVYVPQTEQPLFGAVMGRIPGFTMENILVSGATRFAHAGAMSVLSAPGTMYNPFFLHGGPGLGKTHLLQAMANKFEEQDPGKPIWLTSGPRLARAAAIASANGKAAELEAFAGKARCLLIDDIQLLGVSEENRELLAKIIKIFITGPKQLIMTSAYPHKLLGALEEALSFRIASGHSVELKPPADKLKKNIVLQSLEIAKLQGDEVASGTFGDTVAKDFESLEAAIRRAISLRGTLLTAGKEVVLRDLLSVVFAPDSGAPTPVSEEELQKALAGAPPLPAEGSIDTILLFPTLQETHADWIWSHLAQTAVRNGWRFPFKLSARKAYSMDQVFATPFIVAEECHVAGAAAALVLGPPPGSELSEHEGEFRYVADHLVRDAGIGLGWISFNRVKDAKYAALAYLDMARAGAFDVRQGSA